MAMSAHTTVQGVILDCLPDEFYAFDSRCGVFYSKQSHQKFIALGDNNVSKLITGKVRVCADSGLLRSAG